MSKFWRLWIDVWCVGIMVFGLILAAAGFEGYEGGARMLLNQLNPQNQPVFNGDGGKYAYYYNSLK